MPRRSDIDFEPAGATTFRKGDIGVRKGVGKEPDESFTSARPPPWFVIATRSTFPSTRRPRSGSRSTIAPVLKASFPSTCNSAFPKFGATVRATRRLWFGRLSESGYEEILVSLALPGLTPALVLDLLDEAKTRRHAGVESMAAGREVYGVESGVAGTRRGVIFF